MKKLFAALATVALSASLFAQDESRPALKKPTKPAAAVSKAPVTQAEAYVTFQKVEKALRAVLKIGGGQATKLAQTNTPVSRGQIVLEMDRLFELVKPKFTYKPKSLPVDESVLAFHDRTSRSVAEKLVTWGCIGRFAPLVSGPEDTMRIEPFGDAIGYFIARISELTHTASARFSPYLDSAGGD